LYDIFGHNTHLWNSFIVDGDQVRRLWIDLESLVKAESSLDIVGSYTKKYVSKAMRWMKYAAVDRAVS
jgi:hypothetical protein